MESSYNTFTVLILIILVPYFIGFIGNKVFRLVDKGDITNMWYSGLMYLSFIGLGILLISTLIQIVLNVVL